MLETFHYKSFIKRSDKKSLRLTKYTIDCKKCKFLRRETKTQIVINPETKEFIRIVRAYDIWVCNEKRRLGHMNVEIIHTNRKRCKLFVGRKEKEIWEYG